MRPHIDFGAPAPGKSTNGAAHSDPAEAPWLPHLIEAPGKWYAEAPPKREWLLRDMRDPKARGVLPLGKTGQVIAEGGVGKTLVLCQLAVAVATGAPWLGTFTTPKIGRVLLVLGEEDTAEARRRLYHAGRVSRGRSPDPGVVVVLPLAGVAAPMLELEGSGNLAETEFLRWLRQYITEEDFRLVAIDPLSRFGGPTAETDNAAGTRFVQALESLVSPSRTILNAHHVNKISRGKDGRLDAASGRGSSSLVDGARWQCAMGAEYLKFESSEVQVRLGEIVTFSVTKSNYAKKPDPVLLRRDGEHGGALVPLAPDDIKRVELARRNLAIETPRAQARQAAADDRVVREDVAVLDAVRERPGLSARGLREPVKVRAKIGSDRANTAVERARQWLDVRPSNLHKANGEPFDTFFLPADESRLPGHLRGD